MPVVHGMKRERSVISRSSGQFTFVNMQNDAFDDITKEIFKRTCSHDVEAIATFRSVCKHWYHLFSPATIKAIMADNFENYKAYFFSLINDQKEMKKIENNQDYAALLLDMIQDDAVYAELLPQSIKDNFPQFTQLLLERGVEFDVQKLELAYDKREWDCNRRGYLIKWNRLFGDRYEKMFTLLLQHGLDIHVPLNPTNQTIMDCAIRNNLALLGLAFIPFMLPLCWLLDLFLKSYKEHQFPLDTILKERYKTELFVLHIFVVTMWMCSKY